MIKREIKALLQSRPVVSTLNGTPGAASDLRHFRRTAVGTIGNFAAEALSLPAGFLIAAFLTRQLGPERYGVLAVSTAIVLWIEISLVVIFNSASIKFVAEAADWKSVASALARAELAVGLIAATLLVLVAPILAIWLESEDLTFYLRLFALDIPIFVLADAHRSALIGRGEFSKRALLTAIRWLSRLVLVFLLVGFGLSVSGAILATLGAVLIELIVARVLIPLPLLTHFSFPFRRLVSYALPIFSYAAAMRLFNQLDLLAVKAWSDAPEAAGFFGAAQNLTMIIPSVFASSFAPVLLSALTRSLQHGQLQAMRDMARQSMRLILCLLPFGGLMAGLAPEITVMVYGESFSPSGPLVALLIFGALAVMMISVTTAILVATGRPGLTIALIGPLVPLALGAHWIFVPRFGPVGAATVTTILAWLAAAMCLTTVYRLFVVYPPPMTIIRATLTTSIIYFASRAWQFSGAWLVLALVGLTAIILLLLTVFGEFTRNDLAFARSIFKRQWTG